jgi:phosphoribosylaminoimidazole-succinocarboxamide synthase
VIFEYSDAYSVFDWGRMPDFLVRKGDALAVLAADFFEKLETPEIWKEFSRSPGALSLRKANRFGSSFNEIGEDLQASGLRTHYIGALEKLGNEVYTGEVTPHRLSQMTCPFKRIAVRQVSVVKPAMMNVLGRAVPDYGGTRRSNAPRLIPLEVVFRFGCSEKSSILERFERDPNYLASIGHPEAKAFVGAKWEFPVLELFTKLETSDRALSLSEALAISGLSAPQLQETLLKTAWVAGLLRFLFSKIGVELEDGKLEWAVSETGDCFLVDAIGPDELRIMRNGIQISKEFLRGYYRTTPWFQNVERAKLIAKKQGFAEWKRFVQDPPPLLSPQYREVASQMYISLTNELTGTKWFQDAWTVEKVVDELGKLQRVNTV